MLSFPQERDVKDLKDFSQPGCLTIYMKSTSADDPVNHGRIELKNSLRQAESSLEEAGIDEKNIRKTLRPAKFLLEDDVFWLNHREGLAMYLHPKMSRYYSVPDQDISNTVEVDKVFNLQQLLDIMNDNKTYYVLALGHKKVQLFRGDNYQLHPVNLKDLPSDMHEALGIDEYPHVRELHHIKPASQGKGSSAYHGQYNVKQVDKDMLIRFFRLIDKRLHGFMQSKNEPLILASVRYLQPLYRKVNTYPHVVSGSIKGNVTCETLDNMRIKALNVLANA